MGTSASASPTSTFVRSDGVMLSILAMNPWRKNARNAAEEKGRKTSMFVLEKVTWWLASLSWPDPLQLNL